MKITIIGLGLIGGSMALDLKSQLCTKVYGVDSLSNHADQALQLGLVDEIVSFSDGVASADVIILAIPVNSLKHILPIVLDMINQDQVVIDLGSTKKTICDNVKSHPKRKRYVAAHPLSGTEYSGPSAAKRGLFQNKKNIICDNVDTDDTALSMAIDLFNSVGLTTTFMTSEEHDKHLAYVSHLSHVSSFMLGLTVLDIEKDEKQIFDLASTGFDSTVRLAKSHPDTWSAIFLNNKANVVDALESYILNLQEFSKIIKEDDEIGLKSIMQKSNEIRRILK